MRIRLLLLGPPGLLCAMGAVVALHGAHVRWSERAQKHGMGEAGYVQAMGAARRQAERTKRTTDALMARAATLAESVRVVGEEIQAYSEEGPMDPGAYRYLQAELVRLQGEKARLLADIDREERAQ